MRIDCYLEHHQYWEKLFKCTNWKHALCSIPIAFNISFPMLQIKKIKIKVEYDDAD